MTVKRKPQESSPWTRKLGLRPKKISASSTEVSVHCTSIQDDKALVSVIPPTAPPNGERAACDIVLVIDVSGSMHAAAPLPDIADKDSESSGLDILDLVKHASRVILEGMKPGDRLAVVKFSDTADIVQNLTHMTGHNKRRIQQSINQLTHEGSTNLWAGIRAGFDIFHDAGPSENVQGLFILTDGQPNHMCPSQGYIPKMKPMLANLAAVNGAVPTIHTFGFGYDIRSGLLQSIAELGLGSYAFIPDAGMIGTVFIHAVANLYTTCATHLELEFAGEAQCATVFNISNNGHNTVMRLGNLQYGQSRDFVIECMPETGFTISYTDLHGDQHRPPITGPHSSSTDIPYHLLRTEICSTLTALFPRKPNGEHNPTQPTSKPFLAALDSLTTLTQHLFTLPSTPTLTSLLSDLSGPDPHGQITKALLTSTTASSPSTTNYWHKWGRHYLPSLLHAHARQVCNSFKDPGPLMYGSSSPLFIQCRDELDDAFDRLPAPAPSRAAYCGSGHVRGGGGGAGAGAPVKPVSMARYHNSGSACFDGGCAVRLAAATAAAEEEEEEAEEEQGGKLIRVDQLTAGMEVWTPNGPVKVSAVLKTTPGAEQEIWLARVGELWVTLWHPIHFRRRDWWFPVQVADAYKQVKTPVYSIVLDAEASSHAIEVGGQVCVTMGHGVLSGEALEDRRAHAFFGDREAVMRELGMLPQDEEGRYLATGVKRDDSSELVCGFRAPSSGA